MTDKNEETEEASVEMEMKPSELLPLPKARRVRTDDVMTDKSFEELAVSPDLVAALAKCGFDRPSPVQQAAIPLGRLGSDLIVQAKSGTGKTVVFATIVLERLKKDSTSTQVHHMLGPCCAHEGAGCPHLVQALIASRNTNSSCCQLHVDAHAPCVSTMPSGACHCSDKGGGYSE